MKKQIISGCSGISGTVAQYPNYPINFGYRGLEPGLGFGFFGFGLFGFGLGFFGFGYRVSDIGFSAQQGVRAAALAEPQHGVRG